MARAWALGRLTWVSCTVCATDQPQPPSETASGSSAALDVNRGKLWGVGCRYTAPTMEQFLLNAIIGLVNALALPEVGLSAIFVITLLSATLLPLGSEPIVFAYVAKAPDMFWATIAVATVGNTIGGATSYWLGQGAGRAVDSWRQRQADSTGKRTPGGKWHAWSTRWLNRAGPAALLLSWLPVVGDPLCAVAGYLRLPFWPCVVYMAIGKGVRYTLITATLLWGATFFTH